MAGAGRASEAVGGGVRLAPAAEGLSLWHDAWRRFRRRRLAMVGAAVLAVMIAAVVTGPLVYRVAINEIDFKAKLEAPSRVHPFGTDDLGQDLLARILYGGRISLAAGLRPRLIAPRLRTAARGPR